MSMSGFGRFTLGLGAVFGALGVMSAALAAHRPDWREVGAIATIALAHGPTLLALGLYDSRERWFRLATGFLGAGSLLFIADLGVRQASGAALFPLAAPLGGLGMIGGWLMLVMAAGLAGRATRLAAPKKSLSSQAEPN